MKLTKTIGLFVLIALGVWGIQVLYYVQRNASKPNEIISAGERERKKIVADYKSEERKIKEKYEQEKYLATGKTVYDRIFSKPGHSIIELIQNISKETLPSEWTCEVKVEEFTHFILLIYLPHNTVRIPVTKLATHLDPILKYCSWCLSSIAVFDRTHKTYLFFDKDILLHLKDRKNLTKSLIQKAHSQGSSFSRFNSTTLQCEKQASHLFLPAEISGPNGVVTCHMLFDTGASTTTVSEEVISRTGYDNLATASRRSFSTANGWMSCPIVRREVNIEGFRRNIEIAVNQKDQVNLLGMNYFEGLKYIVDFSNSCIYVWEE
jgi:predicted aspartyl protease